MVFIDTGAKDREELTTELLPNLYRWWVGVRAHLIVHAGPDDMLLITTPAAIWMLTMVGGLPIARRNIFFGPLGIDWIPRSLRNSRWPGLRNIRTAVALLLWRLLAPWLPGRLALRAPFSGFEALVGSRYEVLGAVPEIEPPALSMAATGTAPAMVALLHDARPRKRFEASLAFAIDLAAAKRLPLALVGVPEAARPAIAVRCAQAEVQTEFVPRFDREGFRHWLAANAPDLVALSVSEGIPSTLIEALLAGCRVHVHDVGGIHWLVAYAVDRVDETYAGAPTVSFIWNAESLAAFEEGARAGFNTLLDRVLGPIPLQAA
jgi:hypothetical protein